LFKVAVRAFRHDFSQKHFGFPVNKRGYVGGFTGAFYGVTLPLTRTGLLLNDARAFVDGNTVRYLPATVLCPLPPAGFRLFLPEVFLQCGGFRRFPV
jgi:hypothetical protein